MARAAVTSAVSPRCAPLCSPPRHLPLAQDSQKAYVWRYEAVHAALRCRMGLRSAAAAARPPLGVRPALRPVPRSAGFSRDYCRRTKGWNSQLAGQPQQPQHASAVAAAAVAAASSSSGGQPGGGLLASLTRLANAMVNLFPVFVLGTPSNLEAEAFRTLPPCIPAFPGPSCRQCRRRARPT